MWSARGPTTPHLSPRQERFCGTPGLHATRSLARHLDANTTPVAGVLLEEGELVGDADQRPAVTGQPDDRAASEDGVGGAALVAEPAQVAAAEPGVLGGQ